MTVDQDADLAANARVERAARAAANLRFASECRAAGATPGEELKTAPGVRRLAQLYDDAIRLRSGKLRQLQQQPSGDLPG